jgi:hypothetical protein
VSGERHSYAPSAHENVLTTDSREAMCDYSASWSHMSRTQCEHGIRDLCRMTVCVYLPTRAVPPVILSLFTSHHRIHHRHACSSSWSFVITTHHIDFFSISTGSEHRRYLGHLYRHVVSETHLSFLAIYTNDHIIVPSLPHLVSTLLILQHCLRLLTNITFNSAVLPLFSFVPILPISRRAYGDDRARSRPMSRSPRRL